MMMMEDTQPNEVRLSRKGFTNIPRVRSTRTRPAHAPYPTPRRPGNELVQVHLQGAPRNHHARKRWINDQKSHLRTDRRLSVVSFKYLDRDSVRFTCRLHPSPHSARDSTQTGSHLVDAHLGAEQIQPKSSNSNLAQGSEPGPCRIRPTSHASAGLGDCTQYLENQPSIPSSGVPFERIPVELSTTGITVPIAYSNPVPRRRAEVHTPPPTEIIDLTLDHPTPVVEQHPTRWLSFRSGCVDISFSPRISSPETCTNQQSRVVQTPSQAILRSGDPNLHTAHPNTNDAIPIPPTEDRRSDQLRQHGIVKPTRLSYHSVVLEDEAEVLPLPPDYGSFVRGFTSARGNLPLSLGPRDRPRRILHDHDSIYVVTAHGTIDQVGASVLRFDCNIRTSPLPFEEFIDDACILSHHGASAIILGHAREHNQVAFLSLEHGQVSRHITLHRGWNTAKRPGVSAVTSLMSPLKFASGGYDHRVHLWDIAQDFSGATAVELAIRHTSLVHSLLPVVDASHKLVSVGADRDISIYDVSAERVIQTLKTSCTPHHAHKTDTRSCILLEVSHLETQFEVRDFRMSNKAVQRFGFLAEERRGRFEKADSWSHFVVCGDRNGAVRLWDLRNVSTEVALRQCFNDPIVQVVNTGPRLLACSKRNELACIDYRGEE